MTANSMTSNAGRASALRADVEQLLSQLREARDSSEQRLAELGRVDPMKAITGSSALDQAIAETEQMLARIQSIQQNPDSSSATSAAEVEVMRHRSRIADLVTC